MFWAVHSGQKRGLFVVVILNGIGIVIDDVVSARFKIAFVFGCRIAIRIEFVQWSKAVGEQRSVKQISFWVLFQIVIGQKLSSVGWIVFVDVDLGIGSNRKH